ncbi:MAG: hypothetical protein JOY70_00570 [Acidisphaera sp.]|nr:hypothetical protein [Acidisphaera sp.]
MARRSGGGIPPDYDQNVFINCPFDDAYRPLFRALVFAIFECGLRPRSALEVIDAGEVRFEKIARIVRGCRWGIHDISRTELTTSGLPRFNMPLELGLFLGAQRFGDGTQRRKSCLVLDREHYRYQKFVSDIAGQDIAVHGNDPAGAIRAVRDWLAPRPARRTRRATPLLPRVKLGSPPSCQRSAPPPTASRTS